MKLLHIKETICPHCNAITVSESQNEGKSFEKRVFNCGKEIIWTEAPNNVLNPEKCGVLVRREQNITTRKWAITRLKGWIESLETQGLDKKFSDRLKSVINIDPEMGL